MFICLCKGISDKRIKEMRKEGVQSLRQLQQQSAAGMSCGQCVCDLKKFFVDEIMESTQPEKKDEDWLQNNVG